MKICTYKRHDTKEDIREEHKDMYDCLKRGLDLAAELDCILTFSTYNDRLGRWQIIGYFHPDMTFTGTFNERKRWTGDRGTWWEKTELKPYNPFGNG